MLTTLTAKKDNVKLANLSVINSFKKDMLDQIIVEKNPVIKPAITPSRVVFLHHRVNNNTGPKDDPNPLHA